MNLKLKKFFTAIIFFAVMVLAAGFFVGNFFVTFALERGEDGTPPKAVANIADPNLTAPAEPNFAKEIWKIKSADDLELYAEYFLPTEKSHRWAILVHGYGRDGKFAYDYAEEYLKKNYNVLIPDLRSAGRSEGKFLTMGYFESRDVQLWAEEILKRDSQAKIILHGVSMGAATVLMSSELEIKNLVAVVEDCGYTSAYEMFTAQLEKIFGLPEFPIMPAVDVVSKIKTGVAISEAAPISSVPNSKVPTLFIHGTEDKLVPYAMMEKLFDASNAPTKEKFTVEGAGHADAKNKNPQLYFEKVFGFLEKYIGN